MFRVKLVLLSALVLLAVFIAAPVSASAHNYVLCVKVTKGTGKYKNAECKTEGEPKEWEKRRVVLGEEGYKTTGANKSGTTIKLETPHYTIECKKDSFKEGATITWGGKSAMTVVFEGCEVTSPPEDVGCTVSLKLVLSDVLVTESTKIADEIKTQEGSELQLLCPHEIIIRENLEKRREKCPMPEGKVMKLEHTIKCEPPTAEEEHKEEEESKEASLRLTATWVVEVPPYFWAVE